MKLLAFETATEACSVALLIDGQVIERHEIAPRRHAELALPWADALLAEAGIARTSLDAIACSQGPGAFTGVRLGIALAQGIALGLDLPLLPISTLQVLALQCEAGPHRLAAIDARMGEVYVGFFSGDAQDGLLALAPEQLAAAAELELPDGIDLHGAGTGLAADAALLAQRLGPRLLSSRPQALPRAADLARLAALDFAAGRSIAPELIEPTYLRNKVALTIDEQQASRKARDKGLT